MGKVIGSIRTIIFLTKWAFMSPKAKYAYLWNQTLRTDYIIQRLNKY